MNIVLIEPKNRDNIATVLRSGKNFGVKTVFIIGGAIRDKYGGNIHKFEHQMDTQDGTSSLALIYFESLSEFLNHLPAKTHIVAIEQGIDSTSLENFEHPKNATYIFGREAKGILKDEIDSIKNCIHTLQEDIPIEHLSHSTKTVHFSMVEIKIKESLNLGVCASIVMYDRHSKEKTSII
jgi:tRNA(Leu) C34 or U34 (ribose-2'-O)-methylase TrmL